jgi:ADP-ribose pyrophosphatase
MAKKVKAEKAVEAKQAKTAKPKVKKAAKPQAKKAAKTKAKKAAQKAIVAKVLKPKSKRPAKANKTAKATKPAKAKKAVKTKKATEAIEPAVEEKAQVLSSEVVFEGPLFRVERDHLIEPGAPEAIRDIIRHNGSVVILAVDQRKNKKDPWIVVERQYRHAANRFLWELPAGKLEEGEDALEGAKRELEEETGYRAKKWKPLVEYFASPGFLGESMKVFLAEGLVAGEAHPEADERIELRLVKLSEVLGMIAKGAIEDGKTLTSVLLYARRIAGKHGK